MYKNSPTNLVFRSETFKFGSVSNRSLVTRIKKIHNKQKLELYWVRSWSHRCSFTVYDVKKIANELGLQCQIDVPPWNWSSRSSYDTTTWRIIILSFSPDFRCEVTSTSREKASKQFEEPTTNPLRRTFWVLRKCFAWISNI